MTVKCEITVLSPRGSDLVTVETEHYEDALRLAADLHDRYKAREVTVAILDERYPHGRQNIALFFHRSKS